jgi:ribose/xylose/arabinose/galactoside ABC-type transport system permease subunit
MSVARAQIVIPSGRVLQLVIIAALFLAVLAFLSIESPIFFRPRNLMNVLNQSVMLATLSVGMTLVMVGGGIDLSLPANMALAAIFGSMVMIEFDSVLGGCAVMLIAATAIGALNGLSVGRLNMIPFVVTLAMMTICGGLAVWVTNSVSISSHPERFFTIFLSRPLGIPVGVWVMVVVVILAQLLMWRSRGGWMLYAAGANPVASRISRVPVRNVLITTYVLSGALAGIAAILITARLGSASANIGADIVVLDIVTACVVGGVSIYGGRGSPIGAAIGAVFVIVLGNVLNLMGISFFIGLMIKGSLIVVLVALDGFLSGRLR